MTLTEQVHAQALLMSQQNTEEDSAMLEVLCRAAVASLARQLRAGITPEDCKADFVAAASLYALAARSELDEMAQLEQVTARIARLEMTYSALELALDTLQQAKTQLQRRYAPRIAQQAKDLFNRLTGGR